MKTIDPDTLQTIVAQKFALLSPFLDERRRRLWAAAEAMTLGHGGLALVEAATGISRPTLESGITELSLPEDQRIDSNRIRKPGGGRKPLEETDPEETDPSVRSDLEAMIEPVSRGIHPVFTGGDPQSPLLWVSKSLRHLAEALTQKGHKISHPTVEGLLEQMGYSLQSNRKTVEGTSHPDRNAQFEYLNKQVTDWQAKGQPVISVDCKKKELIGSFQNKGKEWHRQGQPDEVLVHDFVDEELGKAIPYGVYDLTHDQGWVSVGCDHDTAQFAVATIERWWQKMGHELYPEATELMITADGGGSNGSRNRLWKLSLQEFADRSGLCLHVRHFPPGTSKWNKIEHRLFSWITLNWRGRPLVSLEVIIELIASTLTQSGQKVQAELDSCSYPVQIKVSDEQMASIHLEPQSFHGKWNYDIMPASHFDTANV